MPRRRKKKTVAVIYPSAGPLPLRLAPLYIAQVLVFSDASQKRHGGLAAVLFDNPDGEPLVGTQTVAVCGSNELELQAALFALTQAQLHFPGRAFALFSDNHDAVLRLNRGKTEGLAQDPELQQLLDESGIGDILAHTCICWIKGHGTCRGNILADLHAAQAAQ
jgi:ribonuclease HI